DVCKSADRSERCRRIFPADVTRHTDARPSADAGQHSDVLLTVRTNIGHRISDNSRWRLELPQDFAGFGMNRFQPAFHAAVENHVAPCSQGAAPIGEVLFDAPHFLSSRGIPCNEFAPVTAWTRMAYDDSANVRLARLILHFDAFI